jgi:hypothetical protein
MADRRRPPSPCRHDGDDAKSVNFCRNPACGSSTSDIPAIGGHAHTCYRAHDLSQLRRSRPGSGSFERVACESLSVRGCAPGRTDRSPSTWRSVDMFGRARAQCSGARRRRDSDPQRRTALNRVPAGRGTLGGQCRAAGRTGALRGKRKLGFDAPWQGGSASPPQGVEPPGVAIVRGPLLACAVAVLAPRPAAGPALAFLQLLLGPPNTARPCGLPLGILDPADELVAGQWRDVVPGIECRRVG